MRTSLETIESRLEPWRLETFSMYQAQYFLWNFWQPELLRFSLPSDATDSPSDNPIRDFEPFKNALDARRERIRKWGEANWHTYKLKAGLEIGRRVAVDLGYIIGDSDSWLRKQAESYARAKKWTRDFLGCQSPEDFAGEFLYGSRTRSGLLASAETRAVSLYMLNTEALQGKLLTHRKAMAADWIDLLRRNTALIAAGHRMVELDKAIPTDEGEAFPELADKLETPSEAITRQDQAKQIERQRFSLRKIVADAWRIDPHIVIDALDSVINSKRRTELMRGKWYGDHELVVLICQSKGIKEEAARSQFKRQALEIRDALTEIVLGMEAV